MKESANFWSSNKPPSCTPTQLDWLTAPSSMTSRLRTLSKQLFSVKILKQEWRSISQENYQLLQLNPTELVMTREVYLCHDKSPLLYGYSFFPAALLQHYADEFTELSQVPLGDILFNQLDAQRGPFSYCQLTTEHLLYQQAIKQLKYPPVFLWARRSVFIVGVDHVLVYEVFLPDLWNKIGSNTFAPK